MHAAGFVLAGGRSSRMGQDKTRLAIAGASLVEIAAGTVKEAVGNVTLLGDPTQFADLPFRCLPDIHPGRGPLAGIESALASGLGEFSLVLACDMPGVKAEWLQRLLACAQDSRANCVVACDAFGLHPLCAVYHKACLPVVAKAIGEGRLRAQDCVEELEAVRLDLPAVLSNVNTPDEWAAFLTHGS